MQPCRYAPILLAIFRYWLTEQFPAGKFRPHMGIASGFEALRLDIRDDQEPNDTLRTRCRQFPVRRETGRVDRRVVGAPLDIDEIEIVRALAMLVSDFQ